MNPPVFRLPSVLTALAIGALCLATDVAAQETIGGGTVSSPAVGPAPSHGIGGPGAVLVKNWNFGANGTIKTIADLSAEFFYHDQFGTITNGNNYGAKTVAPDAANALPGQPIEGVNCPPVRAFFADSLQTYLQPLDGATTVDPKLHNAGNGSFMAKWKLPHGGSWLGYDIVWETRVRYVTPPYFWFAIWTAGNLWDRGAEHDLVESFGYDNGGGSTNFDGRYWHSSAVPSATDAVNYTSFSAGMASVGITNWDPTVYHTWTLHYKADNTYAFYMDGVRVQYGTAPYAWTLGAASTGQPLDLSFLFDAGWGHTAVSSVNHAMPASNFAGKFYEWDYSRVYFVPPTAAPAAPTGLGALPDHSTRTLIRWELTANASSYNVYRGTSPNGQSATPVATGLKTLSFIDTGLTAGTTYYYKVAGVNSAGTSPLSAEVSVAPTATYTIDDADPAVTYTGTWSTSASTPGYYGSGYRHDGNTGATGTKSARFTPTLPSDGYYDVYLRYPAGSNRATNVPVDINHASGLNTVTINQRVDGNLWVSLGRYFFTNGTTGNVTLRNQGANGYVMADAVRWIPTGPMPPPPPANLSAAPGNQQVALTWSESSGATSYHVYRATTAGGQGATPLATGITGTQYTDTGLTNGTTYYYKVAAVNGEGASALSTEASATPSTATTVVLSPIADAYVQDGTGTNFGASTTLRVKGSSAGSGFNRRSFLKFDLSGVTGTITSVQLTLHGSLSSADTLSISAYAVADTSWSETGIIWTNQPAMAATPLSTRAVTNTAAQTLGWDVTSYIVEQAGGVLSLGLNAPVTTVGALFTASSREAAANKPQLVIQLGGAEPPPPTPQSEYVVDNSQATTTGTWSASSHFLDRYGANYLYKSAGTGTATVKWAPNVTADTYAVYYWLPSGAADRPTAADFKIFHSGGSTSYSVDETAPGGRWILLGTHAFNAGTAGYVLLTDAAPAGKIVIADAIKFVRQVAPMPATVTLSNLTQTYDGTPRAVGVTTQPAGLSAAVTYDGASSAPTNAGSYVVTATITDPNYTGSASGTLTIAKAPASITLGDLSAIYNGSAHAATATTSPAGLPVTLTYDGSPTPPTNAGSYAVGATITAPNHVGSASGTLTIEKAPAQIALGSLVQSYDGTPRNVTTATQPANLNLTITYDGNPTAPTLPGSYPVATTIADANYAGSANGTLIVTITALVRHAPVLNGHVDGSLQVLLPESITLGSAASISGDLLVPGTPGVQLNGTPVYGSTLDAGGAAMPTDHLITLNSGAVLRHVVRRVDPLPLPTVAAPSAPGGTRTVTLNSTGQSPGDFATLRDLTVNGSVGTVAVPPGVYGSFTANGNTGFALGVSGATEPAVYQLQALTLNGTVSRLEIVGPVILTLAGPATFAASDLGAADHPDWLTLQVANGGVTLNGAAKFHGSIIAPAGTVTLNGSAELAGHVQCDQLQLNSGAVLPLLRDSAQP